MACRALQILVFLKILRVTGGLEAVLTLLNDEEWRQWSDREIARQCAVSPSTVAKYRESATVQLGQSKTRKGADGRTIDTTNIGKKEKLRLCSDHVPQVGTLQ
jgi:hypothetical protein